MKRCVFVIFLGCSLQLMGQQSQTTLAIKGGLKALALAYPRVFFHAYWRGQYSQWYDSTPAKIPKYQQCYIEPEMERKVRSRATLLGETLTNNHCTCGPWGTCPKELCSCQTLCPSNLRILIGHRRNKRRDLTDFKHRLGFGNTTSKMAYSEVTSSSGLCWGFSALTKKFAYLAIFGGIRPYNLLSRDESERARAMVFYKSQIDNVLNDRIGLFPGFANLKQLSSTHYPILRGYLFTRIAYLWQRNAMSIQGLLGWAYPNGDNKTHKKTFNKIIGMIKRGDSPIIVYWPKNGKRADGHVVLASHLIKNIDGKNSVCVIDSNQERPVFYNGTYCDDEIEFSDGKVFFNKTEIGLFQIAHNNYKSTVKMAKALKGLCEKRYRCHQEKQNIRPCLNSPTLYKRFKDGLISFGKKLGPKF